MSLRAAQPRRNGYKKGTKPMTLTSGVLLDNAARGLNGRDRLCFMMGYERLSRFCRNDVEAAASRQIVTEGPRNTFTVFREPP